MSLLLWQEGAMKSQLIAAVAADPKLILQIDLLDILRNLHTCRIDLPLDLLFRSSSLTAKKGGTHLCCRAIIYASLLKINRNECHINIS